MKSHFLKVFVLLVSFTGSVAPAEPAGTLSAEQAREENAYTIAHMYAELLEGSRIEVCVFRSRTAAADWLDVPKKLLLPPADL